MALTSEGAGTTSPPTTAPSRVRHRTESDSASQRQILDTVRILIFQIYVGSAEINVFLEPLVTDCEVSKCLNCIHFVVLGRVQIGIVVSVALLKTLFLPKLLETIMFFSPHYVVTVRNVVAAR